MIRRSIGTGLLLGLALALASIYPLLALYAAPRFALGSLPGPLRPVLPILTAALSLLLLLSVGVVAAWRSGATSAGKGFRAGAIAGLVSALVFFYLALAPTMAALVSVRLWTHAPTLRNPYPPNPLTFEFIHQMTAAMQARMALCLIAGALIGGLEGAVVGWLRRQEPPPRPSLLEVLQTPQPRRQWFADNDAVWRAGVLGGLIGGGILWLGITVGFFSNLKVEWPALEAAVQESSGPVVQALFTDALASCLVPIFLLAVLGTGALPVLLLRDPPRRHLSRFHVILIAGLTAAVLVLLAFMQIVYFGAGLSRYLAWSWLKNAQSVNPGGEFYVAPQVSHLLRAFVQAPRAAVPLFYLLPWLVLGLVLIIVLVWIAPQAALYGLTLPLVFRRPVDRAARIARAIANEPASFLPRLYGLYTRDDQAVQVLPHLAFLVKDQAAAEVVAAHHTLSTRPDETGPAVSVIRRTVAEQPTWRWRTEIGELYRVLEEGLGAKTLDQVAAIQPPPQEVTSSLPVTLAQGCEGIGRVLGELTKAERAADLSTKLIFLNSAQAALLNLHRKTETSDQEDQPYETPFPEIAVLHSCIDQWQGFVLTATTDLQGRADLRAELATHQVGFGPRVRQCMVIRNEGLNVAQNIHFLLLDGEGYEVVEGGEQQIDILGPQESRQLEFWLAPDGPRRLRLTWRLTFDDAVDRGRQVEFADALELEEAKVVRPFVRIFPNPYVTGTPLRSGEMFVGRRDIFEFVREHLLGAYQNNVIVLHGQRRTGKTSILYRLRDLLADTHVAVLVDMQGKAARGTADLLYALSDDIAYALENEGLLVELPARAEYEQAPEFTFRSRFLRAAVESLDNRNLLLMFDEFEEMQKRVEDGRLEPEIFPYFRNLMQHEPRLDFIFSGTHQLEELGAEYWSILFNIAAYKRITFLDADEVQRLVVEPVVPYGVEYDPLAVARIIQVTAGHPYFTQVVCHEMVAYHNETERNYLTVTNVDEVLSQIVERGEAHFKYIWAGTTTEEHKVMLALTDLLPDADSTVTPTQIAQELERKGCGLEPEELRQALAHLQARDIVSRSGLSGNLYRFKIDLIRRWIGTARPAF